MKLGYYFPISVGVFLLTTSAAHHFPVPAPQFGLLALFGETLLRFQVEDQKVLHFVERPVESNQVQQLAPSPLSGGSTL